VNRWSHAEGDIVDVDVIDYYGVKICEQCGDEVEYDDVRFEDGDSYCADCFNDVFGEEN
jgi:formylmethanofuran dehydrogenase subunit E